LQPLEWYRERRNLNFKTAMMMMMMMMMMIIIIIIIIGVNGNFFSK